MSDTVSLLYRKTDARNQAEAKSTLKGPDPAGGSTPAWGFY